MNIMLTETPNHLLQDSYDKAYDRVKIFFT